jgi:phenylacetate-CoA ligase
MRKLVTTAVFKGFDFFDGNSISKEYSLIKEAHEGQGGFSQSKVQSFLSSWGRSEILEDNPMMNKTDLLKEVRNLNEDKIYTWAYTGGSYGEPLRVPYSKRRTRIRTATFKYFNELGGYQLGDPYLLIRAKTKPFLNKFLRNELLFVPHNLSYGKIDLLINQIHSRKIKLLLGYPSVIFEIAKFADENERRDKLLSVKSIVTVSEPLENEKKAYINDIFESFFVDRYSNEEVGLIAQQKEFGGAYFTNSYNVLVEVVNPSTLRPVKEGEAGRVVVTDLENHLVPLIRYDTGDVAIAGRYSEGRLLTIKNITGRESEKIYDVSGNAISSLTLGPFIYKPFSKLEKVFQFQFVQIGPKGYDLRLVADELEIKEDVLSEVVQGLKTVIGKEADIRTTYQNEIKPQPSGKRPIYKNEWKQ